MHIRYLFFRVGLIFSSYINVKTCNITFLLLIFGTFFSSNLLYAQPPKAFKELLWVDNDPTYLTDFGACSIEKIEYTPQHMIIHFMYSTHPKTLHDVTIFPPKDTFAWVLQAENQTFELEAIKMVKVNNILDKIVVNAPHRIENIIDPTYFDNTFILGDSSPDYYFDQFISISCLLYFERLPDDIKKVNLIEGVGMEAHSSDEMARRHFNFFDIRLAGAAQIDENSKKMVQSSWALDVSPVTEKNKAKSGIARDYIKGRNGNLFFENFEPTFIHHHFPNPARLILDMDLEDGFSGKLELVDIRGGQPLWEETLQNKAAIIDFAGYDGGRYILRAKYGEQVLEKQIVFVK